MLYTHVIEGRLVDDPAHRTTDSGLAVCRFRIVHNPRWRTASGEWKDGRALFLTVVCWRELADRAAKLHKGDIVVVDASPNLGAHEHAQGYSLSVTANNVAVSMRWHEAVSKRQQVPATPTGDAVVTAEGEQFDAEAYAEYAAERGLTTVS